jgi:hypothetical protein
VAEEQTPFADVVRGEDGFSIPDLKWRELLFIGAMKPDGAAFVRDPGRPMPVFRDGDLFAEGVRYLASARKGRIWLRPEPSPGQRV